VFICLLEHVSGRLVPRWIWFVLYNKKKLYGYRLNDLIEKYDSLLLPYWWRQIEFSRQPLRYAIMYRTSGESSIKCYRKGGVWTKQKHMQSMNTANDKRYKSLWDSKT